MIKVGEKLSESDRGKVPPGTIVSLLYNEKFIVSRKMNTFGQERIYSSSGRGTHCLGIIENFTVEYLPPELPKVGDEIKLSEFGKLPPGSMIADSKWKFLLHEDYHASEVYPNGRKNILMHTVDHYRSSPKYTIIYINN